MGNTVLESTGLGSTQKRILYNCVSVTYICDGIEHINRIFKKKRKWQPIIYFEILNKFIDL